MPHATSVLSFFWYHIKPYKWHYTVMLMAPIVSSFYPFAYNYAIKMLIDIVVDGQFCSFSSVWKPVTLFMATQFILDLVWRISSIAEWKSEPYVRRSIFLQSYDYVQQHAYVFFQEHLTGTLSSKIKGIWDGYDKFWAEMHHGLSQRVLKTVVGLCALSVVSIQLALCVALWLFIHVPLMYKMSLKLSDLSRAETESRHGLMGRVADNMTNIISLFSFASRKRELETLHNNATSDFIPKQIRTYKYDFKMQIIAGVLFYALFAFVLFYMIHLRIKGVITVGDFAFVFGILLLVTDDVWHATISLQDFARVMGDAQSSLSVLQLAHQNPDEIHAKPLVLSDSSLQFQSVNFAYPGKAPLFQELNLRIASGEKVGLVGASGAGKSSIVHLLLRYFKQDSGAIVVGGQNTHDVTQDSLREQIAVIPQDTLLFHRTLMDNIRYGKATATDEQVMEAAKKAHIHEYIISLPEGYQAYVGERGVKLSGGQRQRIAIARAILKNAPILVLDEATSALDSETEQQIQDSLNFLIEDKGKTVLAIAHRLSTLQHMDRLVVLDEGRICEEGTHEELLNKSNSLYRKLWIQQALS